MSEDRCFNAAEQGDRPASPDLAAWIAEKRAASEGADEGPWAIQSSGEKGDGAYLIGPAFGPDDPNCERPLSGFLEECDDEGEVIDYFVDEEVAIVEHRFRGASSIARHIAAFPPAVTRKLLDAVEALDNFIADIEAVPHLTITGAGMDRAKAALDALRGGGGE